MKVIKQSVAFVGSNAIVGATEPYSIQVERAARTCYRSQDKITEGSADKLLANLIKRKHFAMLEFGVAAIRIQNPELDRIVTNTMSTGAYHGVRMTFNLNKFEGPNTILSGNIRGIVAMLCGAYEDGCSYNNDQGLIAIALNELCSIPGVEKVVRAMRPQYEVEYIDAAGNFVAGFCPINLIDVSELRGSMTLKERLAHTYVTMRFITDRGVTHEMVRHRIGSFAQASTRYISYADGKMEIILPVWCSEKLAEELPAKDDGVSGDMLTFTEKMGVSIDDVIWLSSCAVTEDNYAILSDGYNWPSQKARTVLNNSLATEIVLQTNLEEWNHIFNQRSIGTTGAPHPQMQDLMRKAHIILAAKFGDDIVPVPEDGLVLQGSSEQPA